MKLPAKGGSPENMKTMKRSPKGSPEIMKTMNIPAKGGSREAMKTMKSMALLNL